MSFQILLNLVIAATWMFLTNNWSPLGFLKGFLVGLLLLFFMRRFLTQDFYLRRVWSIIVLLFIFLKELIVSSVIVIKQVLSPKLDIRPGIFALPTELKSDWEIATLACLISLTPGTLTLEVSEDKTVLYIHAMDISDKEEMIVSGV
jgi:multicomponent Na+:H+ antiporter subunit E